MLDAGDNCLLTDFGWSGEVDKMKRRETYCGTYEYMAPEVVSGVNQSDKTDIWSLGVLGYELVHGKTPFVASTPIEINQKTLEGSIPITASLSTEMKSFIKSTLRHHPQNRLSGKDLLKHQLFVKYRCVQAALTIPNHVSDRRGNRESSLDKNLQDPGSPTKRPPPSPQNPKNFIKKKSSSTNELDVIRDIETKFQNPQLLVDTVTMPTETIGGMMKKKSTPYEIESPTKEYHKINEPKLTKLGSWSEIPGSKEAETKNLHQTTYSNVNHQITPSNSNSNQRTPKNSNQNSRKYTEPTSNYSYQSPQANTSTPSYSYTKDANGNLIRVMQTSGGENRESPNQPYKGEFSSPANRPPVDSRGSYEHKQTVTSSGGGSIIRPYKMETPDRTKEGTLTYSHPQPSPRSQAQLSNPLESSSNNMRYLGAGINTNYARPKSPMSATKTETYKIDSQGRRIVTQSNGGHARNISPTKLITSSNTGNSQPLVFKLNETGSQRPNTLGYSQSQSSYSNSNALSPKPGYTKSSANPLSPINRYGQADRK